MAQKLNGQALPRQRLSWVFESKFSDTGKLLESQASPSFSERRPLWPGRLADLLEPEPGQQAT